MTPIILSILIFVAIYFLVTASGKDTEQSNNVKKRLTDIKTNTTSLQYRSISNQKALQQNKFLYFLQDKEYRSIITENFLYKFKFASKLRRLLRMADIRIKVEMLLMYFALIATITTFVGIIIPQKALFIIPIGLFLEFFPFIYIKIKIKKRLDAFTNQLPDTLGLISSSLRAGHALLSAFQLVATELPDPISSIFKIAVDDMSLGGDMAVALDKMSDEMPDSMDIRFFVTTVLIQREIGGNLAEILDNLNHTIRERFRLLGQIKTQTAQASVSGLVLALVPPGIAVIIQIMNPEYLKPLYTTKIGVMAIGLALVMEGIGYYIISKITNIRV